MKTKTRITLLILLIVVGVFQISWHRKNPAKVKIGYIEHSSALPFLIAYERGYFRKEGVDVELVLCGFKNFMDTLLTGRVDLITATSFPALFGIEAEKSGLLRFFGTGGEKKDGELVYGILVRKESTISSIKDLKGKKIGSVNQFTTVNLKLILKGAGFEPEKDVIVIPVSGEVAVSALTAGHLDALLLDQPALTIAIESTGARLLSGNPRAEYITNPYWSGAAVVTQEYLEKNPNTMLRIFRALGRAIQDIRDDSEGCKTILAKYTPLKAELAKKTGMYFLAKSSESVDLEKIQFLADILCEYKILNKKVNAKAMYISLKDLRKMCKTAKKTKEK